MNIEVNSKFYKVEPSAEVNNRMEKYRKEKAKDIEILSEICQENDTAKYGKDVDRIVTNMNTIFEGVKNDNLQAISEMNAIQTIMIERDLVKRINLLGRLSLADQLPIGDEYNDVVQFEYSYRSGEAARMQDYHTTFPFATYGVGKAQMAKKQITAGAVTEYYRTNDATLTSFGVQSRHAVDEMYNKTESYLFTTGYELIKNSPLDIKLFNIGMGGISRSAVDSQIGILKRTGANPTIYGTYTMVSQMETWVGFKAIDGSVQFSDNMLDQINNQGVIGMYRGCPVVVINEGVDMSSVRDHKFYDHNGNLTTQKWYNTILPEGIMYIAPNRVDGDKVLKFAMGRVKSMTQTDINNATIARRWDMAFGAAMIPTALPFVGFIGDDRFPIELHR